jgi:hypothetical protein
MMLQVRSKKEKPKQEAMSLARLRELLDIPHPRQTGFIRSIPFSCDDITAGSETELQAAVSGHRECVDLPLTIESSNYFTNILKRAATGDTSYRVITELEEYLEENTENVWENSWLRIPQSRLSHFAKQVLDSDLLLDKKKSQGCLRGDFDKFVYRLQSQDFVRVPASYLMKLALADVLGCQQDLPEIIHETGIRLMDHLLNDNTSPETFSFNVVPFQGDRGGGKALAKETAKRYLLTQLLIVYANEKFSLKESGQKALLYSSPHPPVRQKRLNGCISDSFYRELFMNPCLSVWDNGMDKHAYMCLCHQVLSRSQLNAVAKLRDAGIITRNLVVLPNTSNISLANNGTHISLGSRKLTAYLGDEHSEFTSTHEKFLGDLVIKIAEHFLPLFVGTYSAAPYRLDFSDFHPEKVLGFLPHELDYTHLRMIWRRWKNKASLRIFGQPITPFGIDALDRAISILFGLKGDFVPDFRLIDYFVAVMSTHESPALDGTQGNSERLKKDLTDLGVFDEKMSLYLLCRLREFAAVGFSGFEARCYSLFQDFRNDMTCAANLQALVTAFAYKLVLQGRVTHSHIPDDPSVESERRQIVFGSAIGLPTFFINNRTDNLFMKRIIERTKEVRSSRRYHGYSRVYNRQYRLALVDLLMNEGADLIEMLNMKETIKDLRTRLEKPDLCSALGKLTQGILEDSGMKSPMSVAADEFNLAAERYYRTTLKKCQLIEGLDFLHDDLRSLDLGLDVPGVNYRDAVSYSIDNRDACEFFEAVHEDVLNETIPLETLTKLINLALITVHWDNLQSSTNLGKTKTYEKYTAPVCGEGNR